jgi:TRAP-type mannitol/chloroaromatic compound transport system substrate-binding protein
VKNGKNINNMANTQDYKILPRQGESVFLTTCLYCKAEMYAKRRTKKFCCPSHREMYGRERRARIQGLSVEIKEAFNDQNYIKMESLSRQKDKLFL